MELNVNTDRLRTLADDVVSGGIGGFTISIGTGEDIITGYAVGGDDLVHEVRLADVHNTPPALVLAMLEAYARTAHSLGRETIGGWVHEGDLYLDAPRIYTSGEEAERESRRRGELAYFHLDSGREIATA